MAKYVEILFRFKLRFAFLLVALPGIVAIATILLFPSYMATAQLWVDDPSYYGGTTPSGWSQYLTPAQNESDSLTQLTTTRTFQRDLYDALAGSMPDSATRIAAIAAAKPRVWPAGSHLITITSTCSRPPTCPLLLSKTIEVLRAEQVKAEQTNAAAGVSFLTTQLQSARNDQAQAEDALRRYIAAHPGVRYDTNNPDTIADPELARLAVAVQQKHSHVNDLQARIDRANTIASASTAVIQAGPRVLDQPTVTQAGLLGDKSSLKKAAAAGGATLGLAFVYLFLVGWSDKSLRDPRDIEHRFKVPVVTTIPELQPAERF